MAALSRFYAISRSIWDWDEALFCLGVRQYDMVQHHPHPPGFPLFIAAAKVLRPLAGSDFRALQIVTVLGAVALFPVVFALGRQLRMPFSTAFLGSLLFVFFPNVWFYGGTAFSDVPGTALVIAACALFLSGCRSRGSYVSGAFVLALSIAFRPQSVMIAVVPGALATWFRARDRWSDVFAAAAIGAVVTVASYGGAAAASESFSGFVGAMRAQKQWVTRVDSYHNPGRMPLRELAYDFFVTPMRGGRAAIATGFLALAGLGAAMALRRWPSLLIVALFLPFNIFAWLMLDPATLTRYAVAYVAMHAFLAADFVSVLSAPIASILPLLGRITLACVLLAITAYYLLWTIPALREVRRDPSPPVQAMNWISKNVPRGSRVVVWEGLRPFASYFLNGYDVVTATAREGTPAGPPVPDEYYVSDGPTSDATAQTFVRTRGHLWQIARQRYFEAFVRPVMERVRFGSGWYDVEEDAGGRAWRWAGGRSELELASIPTARAELSLHLTVPLDVLPRPPLVTVALNGAIVDRFVGRSRDFGKRYAVSAMANAPNHLTLSTDEVVNPKRQGLGSDARDLGLQLRMIGWKPLPPSR